MGQPQFTTEQVNLLLDQLDTTKRARIYQGTTERPAKVQVLTIALDTAKTIQAPLKIGFPFRSLYMQDATDTNVTVSVQVGTTDSFQSPFVMRKNDSWASDDPVSEAYFTWTAQAAKTVTFVFFVDSEFRSGTQISVSSGSVSVGFGSTVTTPAKVTLVATTAAAIAPALSTRKQATLKNDSGASIWIGDATVTNLTGIEIVADGIITWQNTGALYAYSVLGGDVKRMEES